MAKPDIIIRDNKVITTVVLEMAFNNPEERNKAIDNAQELIDFAYHDDDLDISEKEVEGAI